MISFYLFTLLSLYLVFYDLKFKRVPNLVLLILFLIGIIYRITDNSLKLGLLSGVIAFIIFILVYTISRGKMGMGDIKYTTITALYFGYEFWLYSIIYCSLFAVLITSTLYLTKMIKKDTKIPFIPFLVLGLVTQYILLNYLERWFLFIKG